MDYFMQNFMIFLKDPSPFRRVFSEKTFMGSFVTLRIVVRQ